MDSDVLNIGLICLLMGAGVVTLIGILIAFVAVSEFLDTFYLED